MPIVNSGGVDIDYEILNPGPPATPVFLISGLGGARGSWTLQTGPFAEERPVVLLTPGNPLFLNAVTRFLVQQARARDLPIRIHPGVSQVDTLVSYLGLDVTTFGLQLFDAQRLVSRRQPVNPAVPLLVLQVAGFAASEAPAAVPPSAGEYAPLADCLARFYAADQPVTLINTSSNGRGPSHVTVQLSRFSELVPHVRPESSLFIDRAKKSR